MQDVRIPIGDRQLAPAEKATTEQINRFLNWYRDQPAKAQARWTPAAKHARSVLEVRAQRAAPPKQEASAANGTAIVAAEAAAASSGLARVTDPATVSSRLAEVAAHCHLLTAATQIDAMPLGYGVSITYVPVNAATDTYPVKGSPKLALKGFKLMQLAAEAGVSWLPASSRIDDGSDPHYCHYCAVGFVRNFDGTPRVVTGSVALDARDGSEIANTSTTAQLAMIRRFILPHAESRARNRAFAASLGIPRSYMPADYGKPFAIARLVYTGHTDDPALTRELALMQAQAAMQASSSMFGGAGGPLGALQAPEVAAPERQAPPPPVGATARAVQVGNQTVDAPAFSPEEFEPWDR